MRLSAERLAAVRLLLRVEGGSYASRLLSGTTPPAVRVRVLETLRWLRALDFVLEPLSRRPLAALDAEVRMVLRLGLVEAMRLDVPPPLATDGAVRLIRRLGLASAAALVNAVLRRAAAQWRAVLERAPLGVRLSHPSWLAERWTAGFGEAAAAEAMASAQEPAVTWVWFRDEAARRRLADEGVVLVPHPWCGGAWSAPGAPGRLVELVAAGAAYAQDPSSQLVAHVAGALAGPAARVLDLCAAPGGKSALLTALNPPAGALALDRSLGRVRLMTPLLEEGSEIRAVAADALQLPVRAAAWDLVLLDAPCTGTGTFRRHPELKWRVRPGQVAELAGLQRRLLAAAAEAVAPGGVLLYSTCSVEAEENEDLLETAPPTFETAPLEPHLPDGLPWHRTAAGGARILPHAHGDGFTIHALRRRASAWS